jgi:putative ABC transport system substrate-binding protein
MNRRTFIAGLGSAAAWPAVARGQQSERIRRIGVLIPNDGNDAGGEALLSAFLLGLQELGWAEGRNAQISVRWAAGDFDRMRVFAKELVDLQPDVILANSTPATAALQSETRTIPIVFVNVVDPVGSGFVADLPHPAGNITGFINIEASMGGKWVELLTQIAPQIKRVASMYNPDTASAIASYYRQSFETGARSFNLLPVAAPVHSDTEIEATIVSLGHEVPGGLIVLPDAYMLVHRPKVIALTARNDVPAIYSDFVYAREGGLLSYGPDRAETFRRAALYVDRILRGAKAADLPVQLPVKFNMTVNVKTAKALGLNVPQSILLRADEVIE